MYHYPRSFSSRSSPGAAGVAQGRQMSFQEQSVEEPVELSSLLWLPQMLLFEPVRDNGFRGETNYPRQRPTIHQRSPRVLAHSLSSPRFIEYSTGELESRIPMPLPSFREHPPRFNVPPSSPPVTETNSKLTRDEQSNVLKQMKLETYKPPSMSKRWCLYYRDQAQNVIKQSEKVREEDGKRCAVCLEDFEPKELVMVTPCKHMFHEECIVPWVKSHGQCPVCRFAICERMRGGNITNSNTNFARNDSYGGDMISLMAMEDRDRFVWSNRFR
ncbi:hypothetical protein ACFE04_018690 [Oxalis oulophora]